jgi:GntR family transcriptional repressor for pyruvate dehydrogenase complex
VTTDSDALRGHERPARYPPVMATPSASVVNGELLPLAPARRRGVHSAVDRPLKMSETVARDIVHDIISRGLSTGDRLSSEAAMLEQYGVSRESLREGLRLLEVQGLITIRRGPGGGPSVGHVDPANLGRISTLYYHLAGGTYAELFEAWVVTEAILAERAARNDDRTLVREAMAPFSAPVRHAEDMAEFVDSHAHFHSVIGRLAGNRVLELTLQAMAQIVTHHVVVNTDPRELEGEIDRDHMEIARAIAAGHAAKARTLMEGHILSMVEHLTGQIGDLDDLIEWR